VWPAVRNNPVLAARYAHLTGRTENKLTNTQARVAVAGSLLRQLHAVITTGAAWDPAIASGLKPHSPASARRTAPAA
jgi:transposase